VFADPLAFDLHRPDLHEGKELRSGGSNQPGRSGHLGFGLGKHFCIGYELARTEAVIGSQLIVDRCPDIRLAPDAEPYTAMVGNSFQAAYDMRFEFTPATVPARRSDS
jgi:cytochrome P450